MKTTRDGQTLSRKQVTGGRHSDAFSIGWCTPRHLRGRYRQIAGFGEYTLFLPKAATLSHKSSVFSCRSVTTNAILEEAKLVAKTVKVPIAMSFNEDSASLVYEVAVLPVDALKKSYHCRVQARHRNAEMPLPQPYGSIDRIRTTTVEELYQR